jgi:hypothetical protein
MLTEQKIIRKEADRTKKFREKISNKNLRTKIFEQKPSNKIFRTKIFEQKFSNKNFRTKIFEQKFSNKNLRTKIFEQNIREPTFCSLNCSGSELRLNSDDVINFRQSITTFK